jgi:hypothetical protein
MLHLTELEFWEALYNVLRTGEPDAALHQKSGFSEKALIQQIGRLSPNCSIASIEEQLETWKSRDSYYCGCSSFYSDDGQLAFRFSDNVQGPTSFRNCIKQKRQEADNEDPEDNKRVHFTIPGLISGSNEGGSDSVVASLDRIGAGLEGFSEKLDRQAALEEPHILHALNSTLLEVPLRSDVESREVEGLNCWRLDDLLRVMGEQFPHHDARYVREAYNLYIEPRLEELGLEHSTHLRGDQPFGIATTVSWLSVRNMSKLQSHMLQPLSWDKPPLGIIPPPTAPPQPVASTYEAAQAFIESKTSKNFDEPHKPATVAETVPHKEKKTMKERIIDSASSTGNRLFGAVKEGLGISGSQAIADRITQSVRARLGDSYPTFFKTPIGKLLEPVLVPAGVMFVADLFPTKIPRADLIKVVCEKAVTGMVKDHGDTIVSALMPMLNDIGKIGEEAVEAEVIDHPTKVAALGDE